MNVRCGIDIVDVSRFIKKIEDDNQSFITKCFTESEIEYCNSAKDINRKAERYAARYAAKEAVGKAIGTGLMSEGVGTPGVKLTGGALEHANNLGMSSVSLSLSHDGGMAIAYCVMLVEK